MKALSLITLIGLFILTSGCQPPPQTKLTEEEKTELRNYVDEMVEATKQYDAEKLANLSLTRIVNLSGGKEAYKDLITQTFESLAGDGVELVTYSIGDITDAYSSDDGLVVFIPYKTEMRIDGHPNGVTETFLIGVKESSGWKFLDSNGLRKKPEMLRKVVPGLPRGIELPTNTISLKES